MHRESLLDLFHQLLIALRQSIRWLLLGLFGTGFPARSGNSRRFFSGLHLFRHHRSAPAWGKLGAGRSWWDLFGFLQPVCQKGFIELPAEARSTHFYCAAVVQETSLGNYSSVNRNWIFGGIVRNRHLECRNELITQIIVLFDSMAYGITLKKDAVSKLRGMLQGV